MNKDYLNNERIIKARNFASIAHEGQVRKSNGRPKIEHLYGVGEILASYGFEEDVIIAGILHDVLEDCPNYSKEDIRKEFGDNVTNYVLDVTEKDKSKSWMERKLAYIEHIKNAPLESKVISAADKIHNLKSLKEDLDIQGDKVWDVFNASKEDKKWHVEEVLKNLKSNGDKHVIFNELNKAIRYTFRPKVIELTGTPEAGKTTILKELKHTLEGMNKSVIIIEESATKLKTALSKKSEDRALWIVLDTMKQFIEAKDKEPDYILVDRGIKERKIWTEFSYQRGDITLEERNERISFEKETEKHYYTDLFIVLTCSYETAIKRKGKEGKFVNKDWINIYNNILKSNIDEDTMYIETDNMEVDQVKNKILEKII